MLPQKIRDRLEKSAEKGKSDLEELSDLPKEIKSDELRKFPEPHRYPMKLPQDHKRKKPH